MRHGTLAVAVVAVLFAVGAWAAPAHAVSVFFVSTGQSGAQGQVDVNHTQYWTYPVSAEVDNVYGGLFDMKRGPQTAENITFTIFEGTFADYGTATPLLSVTLEPADFTQSFGNVPFQGTPINFLAGTTYTGVLASPAADAQSYAYFIKGSTPLFFVDESGNPTNPGGGITPPSVTAVPEPITLCGLVLGMGSLCGYVRRRGRR